MEQRSTAGRVLILGAGYTGHRLALDLIVSGFRVLGTRRRVSNVDEPYLLCPYDLVQSSSFGDLLAEPHWDESSFSMVFTAGPPLLDSVEESLEVFGHFLDELPRNRLANFIYLSSTSVYGDAGGKWVTEDSPLEPVSRSGTLKLRCEEMLIDRLSPEIPVIRVRPGGIYGPGRNSAERYLAPDYQLVGNGEKWTNRIHVMDLVRALARLVDYDRSTVLNVVDGRPVRLGEMVEFLYRRTGRDPASIQRISWEEAERRFSEMRLGLLKPQKRVSNEKLVKEFEFTFQYSDVYVGMKELLG